MRMILLLLKTLLLMSFDQNLFLYNFVNLNNKMHYQKMMVLMLGIINKKEELKLFFEK